MVAARVPFALFLGLLFASVQVDTGRNNCTRPGVGTHLQFKLLGKTNQRTSRRGFCRAIAPYSTAFTFDFVEGSTVLPPLHAPLTATSCHLCMLSVEVEPSQDRLASQGGCNSETNYY
ncbi:unnamed protein product [Protopolystoma xenopodis]|uniref:Secreted protein n=1 Tax=Protopolystoma xenopodis TaxID=117903 RepID=A0A3S5AS32_9PLAT|nr:unnamed protein product [Protopolystoma xenopodis]